MLRWFSHLKIAHKLTLGFGLVLLLMTATLMTDVLASRQQTSVEVQLVNRLYPSRQAANEIVTLVYAANDARLVYVLADNEHAAAQLRAYNQDMQQLRALVGQARTLALSDAQRTIADAFFPVLFGKGDFTTTRAMRSRSNKRGS